MHLDWGKGDSQKSIDFLDERISFSFFIDMHKNTSASTWISLIDIAIIILPRCVQFSCKKNEKSEYGRPRSKYRNKKLLSSTFYWRLTNYNSALIHISSASFLSISSLFNYLHFFSSTWKLLKWDCAVNCYIPGWQRGCLEKWITLWQRQWNHFFLCFSSLFINNI